MPTTPITTTITNEQKLPISVAPVTAGGKPAKIAGAPLWSSSDINVVTLEVAADGLSAIANAVNAGSATITIAADADLGGGVNQISNTTNIAVTLAQATALNVSVGAPS